MSPLTAKLKCPHGNGKDSDGAEAVTEVASDEEGGGRGDHLSILKTELDRNNIFLEIKDPSTKPVVHLNIRGKDYYQRKEIHHAY